MLMFLNDILSLITNKNTDNKHVTQIRTSNVNHHVPIVNETFEKPVEKKQNRTSMVHKAFDEIMEKKRSQVTSSSVSKSPTKKRPFLFFHMRKAGGSSLRQLIHQAANRMHIPKEDQWIPCETGSCVPFSYPPYEPKAIYASHINYSHMVSLFRESDTVIMKQIRSKEDDITILNNETNQVQHIRYHTLDKMHNFDCITNIRPTVDRVVSCWNYRFVQKKLMRWNVPPSSELTPDEWRTLLPKIYDRYNGGCNNEFVRIFGDQMDEIAVNNIAVDSPAFLTELDVITSRISKCVIVSIEDCEGSNKILTHFFPWLHSINLCETKSNSGKVKKTGLMEGAKEAIIEQNYMDELVYRFARKIFDEQLEIASQKLK